MRRLLRFLLWTVACLAAMLGMAILLLATESGTALAVRVAGRLLPGVALEQVEGVALSRLTIGALRLHDTDGVWLEADGIVLAWKPAEALAGSWHVEELSARRVAVLRAPHDDGTKEDAFSSNRLPAVPSLQLDRLAVTRLEILPALTHGLGQAMAIDGRIVPEADGARMTLAARALEGVATSLSFDATLSRRLDARLRLSEASGGVLGQLAAIDPAAPLAIRLDAGGTSERWQVKIDASEGEQALLHLEGGAARADGATAYRVDWSGAMPSRLAATYPATAALGTTHGGRLALRYDAATGIAAIAPSVLRLDSLTLNAEGELGGAGAFQAALDLPSLAPFSVLAGQPLAGSLAGELRVVPEKDGWAAATLDLALRDAAIGDRTLGDGDFASRSRIDTGAWRGAGWGGFESAGSLSLSPWRFDYAAASETLRRIDRFHLAGGGEGIRLGVDGSYALDDGAVSARATVDGDLAAWRLGGKLQTTLTAEGDRDALDLRLIGRADELAGLPGGLDALLRGALAVDAQARLAPDALDIASLAVTGGTAASGASGGRLDLAGKGRYAFDSRAYEATVGGTLQAAASPVMTLALDAEGDAERSRLARLRLDAPGFRLDAKGTLRHAEGLADGEATMAAGDLASFSALAGAPLAGKAGMRATLASASGAQAATLDATLERLVYGGMRLTHLDLDARADDLRQPRGIAATLKGNGLTSGGLALSRFSANAKSTGAETLGFTADATGAQGETPLNVALAGDWRRSNAADIVGLSRLDGEVGGRPLHLVKPASLRIAPGEKRLSPLAIDLAGGRLRAEGGIRAGQAAIAAGIDRLPLDALLPDEAMKGVLSATLDIRGKAASPQATFSGRLDAQGGGGLPPLDLRLRGAASPTRLDADATLALEGGEATAKATLPIAFSLEPPRFLLSPTAAMKGDGRVALALDGLNPWLRRQGHEAGGRLDGDFRLAGRLDAPQVEGRFALRDARYDHLASGVCLRETNAVIEASERAWRLSSLTAGDGQGGTLEGSGRGSFSASAPLEADLGLRQLRLFCRGMATGQVAGDLHARGTLAATELNGALRLGPLAINLPGGSETRIPDIPIVRKGERPKAPGGPAAARSIALAIDVDVPGRVFVRGRGLDAELGGKLRVGGTAARPEIHGKLATRRGRFDLLDRPLSLEKAELAFAGPVPPSPTLDVQAESRVDDVTVTVALTGPAMKPSLTLSSTPALPQDELLSRLLFGRDVKSISAFQAIQLAQSIAALSGKGGGPGLLDQARSALGVDTLTLDQGENNGTTVGAGKYVSDRVFVGVAQGAAPEDRKVTTEIEVTPNVSAGTSTDAEGRSGASLEWKWDY